MFSLTVTPGYPLCPAICEFKPCTEHQRSSKQEVFINASSLLKQLSKTQSVEKQTIVLEWRVPEDRAGLEFSRGEGRESPGEWEEVPQGRAQGFPGEQEDQAVPPTVHMGMQSAATDAVTQPQTSVCLILLFKLYQKGGAHVFKRCSTLYQTFSCCALFNLQFQIKRLFIE